VNLLANRRFAQGAVLVVAAVAAGRADAGLPPAADDSQPAARATAAATPAAGAAGSTRAEAGLHDETNLVPATVTTAVTHRRAVPTSPGLSARLFGRAPVDAVVPTTVMPRPAVQPKKKKKPNSQLTSGEPLKVTPPLAGGPYVFPVTGDPIFGDTYGAARSDVPGGWHHGDDIFAPVGTPVVAVADGTINRAGWEEVGGWRLWVRDRDGDEFYYAHFSGYAPLALLDGRVKKGEVIGFVGNTGDAFTTLPHLHFEVHPRSLLRLQYNGAVDPTRYLDSWPRLRHVAAPPAVHPPFPAAEEPRYEAVTNFRELLRVHPVRPRAKPARPAPPPRVAAPTTSPPLQLPLVHPVELAPAPVGRSSSWRWAATDAIAAVAVLGLMMWRRPVTLHRRDPAEARLDAALAAARAELDANLATLRAVRRAAERSRRASDRPIRRRLPVRTR